MDEILHVEIKGKFNGRDASLNIGLEAETAFEIEKVNTSEPAEPTEATEATEDSADAPPAEVASEQSEPQYNQEDLPPLSSDTKQFLPAKLFYDFDEVMTSKEAEEKLEEEVPDEDWNSSKVSSHLHSLLEKKIIDREKNKRTGKYEYHLTELGRAAVENAL